MLACAFVNQRTEDPTLCVVHLVGEYWAPVGIEEATSGKLYAFVGDRSRGGNPPMVCFNGAWLGTTNVRFGTDKAIDQFYGDDNNATKMLPYDATLAETAVPMLPMIPLAWVHHILDKRPTAYKFGEYIKKEITDWSGEEKEEAAYLLNWCRGACYHTYQ